LADNITYNGTGATVPSGTIQKTDETTSGHVPYVKLLDGTANSEVAIPGDATNGLDVDVTRVQGTVAVTQSGTWAQRAQDGAGNALTSKSAGTERAITVAVVDGSGNQITAFSGSGGTASNFGSADPSAGTAAGFSDGANMRQARVFEVDSGAGTQYVLGAVLRKSASGGSVELGTASDPIRTDPVGTTTQPVNVAQINGVTPLMGNGASGTGAQRVTIANDSTGQVAIAGTVTVASHAVTNAGTFAVQNTAAIPIGTNSIGTVGLDNTGTGYSISRVLAAASTNATSVKASAGRVHGWYLFNASASAKYFKLYNKASAPTVGSDTPVLTIPIPAGAGANVEFVKGIAFATGIAFALTGALADNDTTALSANDVVVNLLYI